MRLDEHFKDTMRRAVANEPPLEDAWARFERRAKRSRVTRSLVAFSGAAAVIAAGLVVVPRLLSNDVRLGPDDTPTAEPSATPVDATAGWRPFLNATDGYAIKQAPTWRRGWFEGHTEWNPPGFRSAIVGEPTFAIEVWRDFTKYTDVPPPGSPSRRSEGSLPGGEAYVRFEQDRRVTYHINWRVPDPKPCSAPPGADCTQGLPLKIATVFVDIVGIAGDDRWPVFRENAERMARSLDRFEIVLTPGYTAEGVQEDGFTRVLGAFLQARGGLSGAERFLTAAARDAYTTRKLLLYSADSNTSSYGSFKILKRIEDPEDAQHPTFIIALDENSGRGDRIRTIYERIAMGAGLNAAGEEFGGPYEGLVTGASICDESCRSDNGVSP